MTVHDPVFGTLTEAMPELPGIFLGREIELPRLGPTTLLVNKFDGPINERQGEAWEDFSSDLESHVNRVVELSLLYLFRTCILKAAAPNALSIFQTHTIVDPLHFLRKPRISLGSACSRGAVFIGLWFVEVDFDECGGGVGAQVVEGELPDFGEAGYGTVI